MSTPKQTERQNRILKTAFSIFSRKGFLNANLDAIARKAGVGKATLYRHFENKEGLFVAVFDASLQRLEKVIRGKSNFSNFEKGARTAIRTFLEEVSRKPEAFFIFQMFFSEQASLDGSLRKKLSDRYLTHSLWGVDIIRHAQEQGEIRSDISPEDLTYQILGMIHTFIFQWIREGKSFPLAGKAKVICTVLFRGIIPAIEGVVH